MITIYRACVRGFAGLAGFAAAWAASSPLLADQAVLQGLDKITARISTFEAPLNEAVQFGSLEIIARNCYKTPPEEPPEAAAFLEVVDVRPDSDAVRLFTGWMFASSPAVSALEHAVYDVWVLDCQVSEAGAAEEGQGDAPEAEGDQPSSTTTGDITIQELSD
ncbi:MAG: DUF2155 domain-containing protein [Pseudomonadota bacterium]